MATCKADVKATPLLLPLRRTVALMTPRGSVWSVPPSQCLEPCTLSSPGPSGSACWKASLSPEGQHLDVGATVRSSPHLRRPHISSCRTQGKELAGQHARRGVARAEGAVSTLGRRLAHLGASAGAGIQVLTGLWLLVNPRAG